MSDMRTQVGVWIIACILAVVFNLPAQNATNCVFLLPDTADALRRLDPDKRWNASLRRNMEGDQDALLMARANNEAELQKFVSPGKSYVVLEWMGGFQSGYNVAVLTEQSSILSRTDVSGVRATLALSATNAAKLFSVVKEQADSLRKYQGGSPEFSAFDVAILFARIALEESPSHSVATYFPRRSFGRYYGASSVLRGYQSMCDVLEFLAQTVKKQEFVLLSSTQKDEQGKPVVPHEFFEKAFQ